MFRCVLSSILILGSGIAMAQPSPLVAPSNWQSPADEKKSFKLPPGFEAQLVASDPDILKPMQLAFDLQGRLWVTMSQDYPFPAVGREGKDRVMVFSDFGEDGKAAKAVTFADGLNIPIGVLPLPDGKSVLVSSIDPGPDGGNQLGGCWIWKLTDTNGDGKADKREKLYGPFGTRDTHGMVNSFTLMPDGWVYACHGFANDSHAKGSDGKEVHMNSGNTFRFRIDGSHMEAYTRGQVNPFGMTFDPYFNLYNADCHSRPMTQLIRGAYYDSFGKPHDGLGFGPNMISHDHSSTGLCGLSWYEANQFPASYRGMMFLGNVVTSRVNLDKIEFTGSSPKAIAQPDFLVSGDLWFRPVDLKLGPDGALYISDFYNKIIGHYEVDLKHPGRDRTSGRIWRVVYKGADATGPVQSPPDLTKLSDGEVDKLLGSQNITLRTLATHELLRRGKPKSTLDPKTQSPEYRAHRLWIDAPLSYAEPLMAAHSIRKQTANGVAKPLPEEAEQKAKQDPQVLRAVLDQFTALPSPAELLKLIDLSAQASADDAHLRHAIKIALREKLTLPETWASLPKKELSDRQIRILAAAALGLPNQQGGDFIKDWLKMLSADSGRLAQYVQHATRYAGDTEAVSTFVRLFKPDNLKTSLNLFQAYQRGLQQRGKGFTPEDVKLAESFVSKGLKENDAQVTQSCIELTNTMKLKGSFDAVAQFATSRNQPENLRVSAFLAMAAIDQPKTIQTLCNVVGNAEEAESVREKAAMALGGLGTPAAIDQLLATLEKAPARVQTSIAAALAGNAKGAEQLLKTVALGKASARLLQERAVQVKLQESKLPGLNERVAELTRGLPSADQRMLQLISQRKASFAKFKPNAEKGALLFKNNCANCHQLAREGAKVGPQLDGIGARGLERLLEDVLDPSRNVDQAFRASTLNLADGRNLTGLVLREEGEILILADALGKEVRVAKKDVEERKSSLLSPMPANFADTLKEEEFLQLMAYLLNQRTKEN
jgi:putative heme-binding domain-containing protein